MWWACLFPVVRLMLMLLELTHPPVLGWGLFPLPTLVMNYSGFFFFLNFFLGGVF